MSIFSQKARDIFMIAAGLGTAINLYYNAINHFKTPEAPSQIEIICNDCAVPVQKLVRTNSHYDSTLNKLVGEYQLAKK